MKKLLTAQLLLLFTIVAFAQTKPSNEETIKWISEKINAYGLLPQEYKDVKEVTSMLNFIIRFDEFDDGELEPEYSDIVNIEDIVNYDKHDLQSKNMLTLLTDGDKVTNKYSYQHDEVSSDFLLELKWDAEPDLKSRFLKAMDVLIKYNKESIHKETF